MDRCSWDSGHDNELPTDCHYHCHHSKRQHIKCGLIDDDDDEEWKEDPADLQAGHLTNTANMHY
ncbi:hypothetical protein RUND412_010809, partial [Rhizina undulata]